MLETSKANVGSAQRIKKKKKKKKKKVSPTTGQDPLEKHPFSGAFEFHDQDNANRSTTPPIPSYLSVPWLLPSCSQGNLDSLGDFIKLELQLLPGRFPLADYAKRLGLLDPLDERRARPEAQKVSRASRDESPSSDLNGPFKVDTSDYPMRVRAMAQVYVFCGSIP